MEVVADVGVFLSWLINSSKTKNLNKRSSLYVVYVKYFVTVLQATKIQMSSWISTLLFLWFPSLLDPYHTHGEGVKCPHLLTTIPWILMSLTIYSHSFSKSQAPENLISQLFDFLFYFSSFLTLLQSHKSLCTFAFKSRLSLQKYLFHVFL